MKIRNGFVSNSSSSSFICEVCNEELIGRDVCLSDAEMYMCVNGHTFCESHALEVDSYKDIVIGLIKNSIKSNKYYIEKYGDCDSEVRRELLLSIDNGELVDYDELLDEYEFRYYFPVSHCPICQMEVVTDRDMVNYLVNQTGKSIEEIKEEIKYKYSTYDEIKELKK